MLAFGLSIALVAPLSLISIAPAQAFGSISAPIAAGIPSSVGSTVDGFHVDVTYSAVYESGFVSFDVVDVIPDGFSPVPDNVAPLVFVRTILLDANNAVQDADGTTATTCIDLSVLQPLGELSAWKYDRAADRWFLTAFSGSDASTYCIENVGADSLVLISEAFTVTVPDVDVTVESIVGNVWGFGNPNGTYLSVDITNNESTPVIVGLGADLFVEGVSDKLWLPETWNLNLDDTGLDAGSFLGLFGRYLEPGQALNDQVVPDWRGKSYTFWAINVGGTGVDLPIGTYQTGGAFTRVVLDFDGGLFEIGTEASFAGESVFPGATTTIEAEGLTPGETYELWLAPGLDYLSFLITGGVLPANSLQVGTGTVDGSGRLATAFTVPLTAQLGASYQLVIGEDGARSWPAGTSEPIRITAPDATGTVAGPTGGQPVVNIPLGGTNVTFSFPTGTSAGTTTASASATGPVAVGFTLQSSPPVYYHLSSTATFAGLVEVCVTVGAGVDPAPLRLYHYELTGAGYAWADITSRRTADAVCGLTSSFSPFVLGVPNVPIVVDVVLTNKEQCKNGGWATSTLPVFTNQGKCVSYFAAGHDKPKVKDKPKGNDKPKGKDKK